MGDMADKYFGKIMIDPKDTMDGYLHETSWRSKENSNVSYSVGGLVLHNSQTNVSAYMLDNIYSKEVANAHRDAWIHLHDLGWCGGYCCGNDLQKLIKEGFGGVPNKIDCAPAKHLNTLMNQMVNYLGVLQNEWAGAQAFSSFDTLLSPFIKYEGLTDKEIKQCCESFLYGINIPSRWGSQPPFSNVTLDVTCPPDLKNKKAVVCGVEQDFTYGDCQEEMDRFNRQFLKTFREGDGVGNPFQYPIVTFNVSPTFQWDTDIAQLIFEITAKYGTPYFANYGELSGLDLGDTRSMCVAADTLINAELKEDAFEDTETGKFYSEKHGQRIRNKKTGEIYASRSEVMQKFNLCYNDVRFRLDKYDLEEVGNEK